MNELHSHIKSNSINNQSTQSFRKPIDYIRLFCKKLSHHNVSKLIVGILLLSTIAFAILIILQTSESETLKLEQLDTISKQNEFAINIERFLQNSDFTWVISDQVRGNNQSQTTTVTSVDENGNLVIKNTTNQTQVGNSNNTPTQNSTSTNTNNSSSSINNQSNPTNTQNSSTQTQNTTSNTSTNSGNNTNTQGSNTTSNQSTTSGNNSSGNSQQKPIYNNSLSNSYSTSTSETSTTLNYLIYLYIGIPTVLLIILAVIIVLYCKTMRANKVRKITVNDVDIEIPSRVQENTFNQSGTQYAMVDYGLRASSVYNGSTQQYQVSEQSQTGSIYKGFYPDPTTSSVYDQSEQLYRSFDSQNKSRAHIPHLNLNNVYPSSLSADQLSTNHSDRYRFNSPVLQSAKIHPLQNRSYRQ